MSYCYREKRYICGEFEEVQIFPVFPCRTHGGRRSRKRKPSSEVQKKLNERNAQRKLSRLVHTNFKNRDYAVTFTYTNDCRPVDEQSAKRDIQNFMRKARRIYKKADKELKYIWVLECSEKTGKIHFHTIMSGGVDRTQLEEMWGKGYANIQSLKFDENGVEGIVHYFLKDKLTYRRWSCSKNLEKPKEKQNDSRITYRRAKKLYEDANCKEDFKNTYPHFSEVFGKCEILEIYAQQNEVNGEFYIGIRLRKVGRGQNVRVVNSNLSVLSRT